MKNRQEKVTDQAKSDYMAIIKSNGQKFWAELIKFLEDSRIKLMFSFLGEGSEIFQEEEFQEVSLMRQSQAPMHPSQGQATVPGTPVSLNPEKNFVERGTQNFIDESEPDSKPKETNSNLIKNLIVALKEWVDLSHHPEQSLVRCLWTHFKKSKKANKTLLLLLFGNQRATTKHYRVFLQIIDKRENECTLKELLETHITLRIETLKQLRSADPEHIVRNRRVQNKEQFKNYFFNFIRQIEKGGITFQRGCLKK